MRTFFCTLFLVLMIETFVVNGKHKTTKDPEFARKFFYNLIRRGDGKNFPAEGDQVTVHYRGSFPGSGRQFDSSYQRKEPFQFELGSGSVIKCWDEVVSRMSLGERGLFICPADTAYGEDGVGEIIPPKADLQFEIEVLEFRDKKFNPNEL